MSEKLKIFLLLFIATLVISGNTLQHEYVLDDDVVYLQNKFVQKGFSGIGEIVSNGFLTGFNGANDQSYRPLVLINFAIEHALFGNNPKIGHFMNVLFYALCGFIVFLLSQRLFPKWNSNVHLIVALLYLVHPVHTEVVANIKGRDDILHFIFAMSSLYYSLKYIKSKLSKELVISVGLFFLALLCKEMAVTFLAIIPITLYFFTKADWPTILKTTAGHFGAFVLYMGIRMMVLEDITLEEDLKVINNALAAAQSEVERLSTCLMILVMYIKLLFFPHPLSWDYSFNQIPIVGLSDWQALLSIAILIGLGGYAVMGWKKKDPIAWTILFFFICMSVVSNILIPIGATLGERFLFTPSFVFPILLVLLLAKVTKTDLKSKVILQKMPFVVPIAILSCLFLVKTIQRNKDWKDNFTLYESGIRTAPNSSRTWASMGTAWRMQAETSADQRTAQTRYKKAIEHYQKSINILDANFGAWYNMGVSYDRMGKTQEALAAYKKTVEHDPRYENAWNNIGVFFFNRQEYDKATFNFKKVLEINPEHIDALTNLGGTYHNQGNIEEAIPFYLKALEVNPESLKAIKNIALAYNQLGRTEEAAKYRALIKKLSK